MMSIARFTTCSVRCRLAPGGSCSTVMRYPWSCSGMKPVGVARELEAGGADQRNVDHHDDRQAAHKPAGQRAVGVRQPFEPAVEAARRPPRNEPSGQIAACGLMRVMRA